MISRLKETRTPVLITGESGTGKELVARAIHFRGPLAQMPFVAVDCGALVPTLMESELFGHEKGAFTGALKTKAGLFQAANGGTIFLDEIGELPSELQAKLLRVLQEKEVRPVGSNVKVPVDVRVIAATNRDLEAAYRAGPVNFDVRVALQLENPAIEIDGLQIAVGRMLGELSLAGAKPAAEFGLFLDQHDSVPCAAGFPRGSHTAGSASDNEEGSLGGDLGGLPNLNLERPRDSHAQVILSEHLRVFVAGFVAPNDQLAQVHSFHEARSEGKSLGVKTA